MKSKLGFAVAALLAMSIMGVAVYLWISLGSVDVKPMGYIALIGGGLATFGLGAGLMALAFYSNRKGYDERAGASPLSNKSDQL